MSSFACENLSRYLRLKLAVYSTRLRVTELIVHLPCLTSSDREEICAKRDFSGNFEAIVLLLNLLQKRLNWPVELIQALEQLEHPDLAEELRTEWNRWTRNQNQIHPLPPSVVAAPAASPGPVSAGPPAASAGPVSAGPPAASAGPVSTGPPAASHGPVSAGPPAASAGPVSTGPPAASPGPVSTGPRAASPGPVSTGPPAASPGPVSTGPPAASPSPVSVDPPAASPGPVSADLPAASPGPVSSDPPAASTGPVCTGPPAASPGPVSTGPPAASPGPVSADPPAASSPMAFSSLETNLPTPEVGSQTATLVSFPQNVPEKCSVQETSTPTAKVITSQPSPPWGQHYPPLGQPSQSDGQHSPPLGQQSTLTHLYLAESPVCSSMDVENLNKPGPLVSSCQDLDCPTGLAAISEDTPYSGDSGRLEISKSSTGPGSCSARGACPLPPPAPEPGTAGVPAHIPSLVKILDPTSDAATTANPLPCGNLSEEQMSHNEPEENTYQSSCPSSLENQEVLHHEFHLSEDASIQNNDGQTPEMLGHWSSGPHHDTAEACLGNSVSNLDGSQSLGLNMMLNRSSTFLPGSAPPLAAGTRVNGSSNDLCVPEHMRLEVSSRTMTEATGVSELKLEQEEEGASITWAGIYSLLGAVGVVVLFIAWRMKK